MDFETWQKRDLDSQRFLYIWADGVYFRPRMTEEKQCILVIVGADEYGRKELLAMTDGFRESTQSWREVLLDLKRRGPETGSEAGCRPLFSLQAAIAGQRTAPWGCGPRCARCSPRRESSAAGFTQP